MKNITITLSGKRSANVKFLARFAARHNLATSAAAYTKTTAGTIVALSNDQLIVSELDADRIAVALLHELDGCYGRIHVHGVPDKKYKEMFPNYVVAVAKEQKVHRGTGRGGEQIYKSNSKIVDKTQPL